MKVYKKVTIPAVPARPEREEKKFFGVACDLCGRNSDSGEDWGKDVYDVEETEIRYTSGHRYPDSGDTKTVEYHICPACFTGKLVPWMKSQGASPTESEHSY